MDNELPTEPCYTPPLAAVAACARVSLYLRDVRRHDRTARLLAEARDLAARAASPSRLARMTGSPVGRSSHHPSHIGRGAVPPNQASETVTRSAAGLPVASYAEVAS